MEDNRKCLEDSSRVRREEEQEIFGRQGVTEERHGRMLADIVENVPSGICVVALDEWFTLLYGNHYFYRMYGYTPEQLQQEAGNRIAETVLPEDLPNVHKALAEARAAGREGFESEHRIVRRDGTVQWSLVRGIFSPGDGKHIYCITIDITSRRKMEEALRVNEERFRIALAQTDNTIFDYDIKEKRMLHGNKSAQQYGLATWTENVPDSLVESQVVHPETAQDFLDMYAKISGGAPAASCQVKTRMAGDGRYTWHKISMTAVFDGEGRPIRAVGFLEDIDAQKRREEALRQRSERDALTGLFNKGATEDRIEEVLRRDAGAVNALFIIDIDEFKSVNDHHGHLFGDRTLAEGARRLGELFHSTDIIGRIGGDEFIVFMMNLRNDRIVGTRAREICAAFQKPFESGGDTAQVSCSVGVAVSPRDGGDFRTLYQKSDIALYDAKKHGKNQFRLFEAGMETGMDWKPCSNTTIDAPADAEEAP